jgi:hypothetical protein
MNDITINVKCGKVKMVYAMLEQTTIVMAALACAIAVIKVLFFKAYPQSFIGIVEAVCFFGAILLVVVAVIVIYENLPPIKCIED